LDSSSGREKEEGEGKVVGIVVAVVILGSVGVRGRFVVCCLLLWVWIVVVVGFVCGEGRWAVGKA
jgi:hypothetical protein